MIKFWKTTENGIEQFAEVVNNCWIQVMDPTPDEICSLKELGIPQDFITYPLDVDERSRSEREDDGTLLVIVRVPFYQGEVADVPYSTMPLGIIVNDKFIVTVTRQPYQILDDFAAGKMRGLSTGKRYRFILRILLNICQPLPGLVCVRSIR